MKFAVGLRLCYIEFCLETLGNVQRGDLTQFFDISTPQASKDLTKYQTLNPDSIQYNKSLKHYQKTENYKPWRNKIANESRDFFGWLYRGSK